MKLKFTKMHGIGNDFVLIDFDENESSLRSMLSTKTMEWIADRRLGIGCDQIIGLEGQRVSFWNADGSEAEMCGNGMRAVGLYLNQKDPKSSFEVETKKGKQVIEFHSKDNIRVNLGDVSFSEPKKLKIKDREFDYQEVNVGNPHVVIFVKEVNAGFVCQYGPLIERHENFPNRTNVEFVKVGSPTHIEIGVWERGAGYTKACGTGACAAAVSTIALNGGRSPMTVKLPGGVLEVTWVGPGSEIYLAGSATRVFDGEIELPS